MENNNQQPTPTEQPAIKPVAQPSQIETPKKLKRDNWKIFLFTVIGILGIIVIFITIFIIKFFGGLMVSPHFDNLKIPPPLSYVPSPTPSIDPTANWKTYTNTKYGFEIKYPNDYKIEKENESEVSFSGLFQPGNQVVPASLVITTEATDLSKLKDCSQTNWDTKIVCLQGEIKNIKLNNHQAVEFSLLLPGGGFGVTERVQTVDNPKIEIYRTVYGGGGNNLFEQILSTFKFTDQNQTIDTSNWKTYTDNQFFFIKYPPDWEYGKFGFFDPKSVKIIEKDSFRYGKNGFEWPEHYVSIENTKYTTKTLQELIKETNWQNMSFHSQKKLNGYDIYLTQSQGEASRDYTGFFTDGKTELSFQTTTKDINGNAIENQILSTIRILPDKPEFHTVTKEEIKNFPLIDQAKFSYKKEDNVCDRNGKCQQVTDYYWSTTSTYNQLNGFYSDKTNINDTGWNCKFAYGIGANSDHVQLFEDCILRNISSKLYMNKYNSPNFEMLLQITK